MPCECWTLSSDCRLHFTLTEERISLLVQNYSISFFFSKSSLSGLLRCKLKRRGGVMMVSKKGKRGLVTGSGSKASGLSSKGRSSVVAEASCRGEWLENVEAPAHSSAAMCHRPCGHSATGEPVRSRHPGRPAGYHVGATRAITGPPPPGAESTRRSCSFSAPEPAAATDRTRLG